MGNIRAALVQFEPATDFVILPWLDEEFEQSVRERPEGILLGALIEAEQLPGGILQLDNESFSLAGRLRKTDTFLDTSIFFPQAGASVPEFSWLLVRLRKDAFLDFMVNRLETNIAGIEVIARPEMLKTINDQLHGLLRGGGFTLAASLVGVGVFLVAGAMFALTTQERRREFGLLKAMGAGNAFVFKLVIKEAVALTGLGSLLGMAFVALWLLLAGSGFAFGGASSLSFLGFVVSRMVMSAALTVAVGVLAALYPAWLASALEPYEAIRGGE
jgi:putative ABC transport system permease protein